MEDEYNFKLIQTVLDVLLLDILSRCQICFYQGAPDPVLAFVLLDGVVVVPGAGVCVDGEAILPKNIQHYVVRNDACFV
jgi:hypothetical protein